MEYQTPFYSPFNTLGVTLTLTFNGISLCEPEYIIDINMSIDIQMSMLDQLTCAATMKTHWH